MEVRPARADELAAVGALTVAGYDAEGYLVRPDGSYDEEYASWLGDAVGRAQDASVLVAVDDDRLLGTVTWCPYGSAFAQLARLPHQGELRTLSVDPAARRSGVARALMDACFDRARESGLSQLVLCSLPEMRPAHALYASYGFARTPDLDWSPTPVVDLWAFAAPVEPAFPHPPS